MNIRCSCGRSFDASVDVSVPEVIVHCPSCGQELRVRNHKAAAAAMSPSEVIAEKVKRRELISGLLWLVIGAVQVFLVYTAAAGVWNVINAIIRLRSVGNIRVGNLEVVPWYEKRRTSLIVFAVVNIVLGGVVGVALVAFDWWVRDYVIKNKTAFVGDSAASAAK